MPVKKKAVVCYHSGGGGQIVSMFCFLWKQQRGTCHSTSVHRTCALESVKHKYSGKLVFFFFLCQRGMDVAVTPPCHDVMCCHDNVLSCFYSPDPFALFRPHTGADTHRATIQLSAEREEGGNHLLLFSYLSLKKKKKKTSDEENKCSSPALVLPLIYLCAPLCLTVRVLVEHGSSDTFHIALCCVCSHMHLCKSLLACVVSQWGHMLTRVWSCFLRSFISYHCVVCGDEGLCDYSLHEPACMQTQYSHCTSCAAVSFSFLLYCLGLARQLEQFSPCHAEEMGEQPL